VRTAFRSAGFALFDLAARLGLPAPDVTRPARASDVPMPVRGAALATTNQTANLPAPAVEQPCTDPQLFALVDASNPTRIYYYGVDVGNAAFTIRRDRPGAGTNFGSWISVETAFEKLDRITGPHVRLALVFYDSVPVEALVPLSPGWPARSGALSPSAAELDGPAAECAS
jgi:hypothetical protein